MNPRTRVLGIYGSPRKGGNSDLLLDKVLDEGMIVMKPDIEAFAKAVREVPHEFEDKWGKGLYDRVLQAQK